MKEYRFSIKFGHAKTDHMRRHLITYTFALMSLVAITACSKPAEIIGIDNPEKPASSVLDAKRHEIFIAASRQACDCEGELYSDQRSPSLSLASVTVSIPPNHTAGEIERAKSLLPDPSKHFVVPESEKFQSDREFIAAVNAELATRAHSDRDVLLFVHGFNNTLTDSVLRVAQFVEDTGFKGVPVLFSWASAGRVSRYVYDINSVLAARPLLEETKGLLTLTNASGFDIFAHSMGTLLVVEVLVQSDLQSTMGDSGKLRNVMLAAPDIDIDVFRSQLGQIKQNPGNIYVFVSEDDRALNLSRKIAGGIDRLGDATADELSGLGITVVDLSNVDDFEGRAHSKYAGSPEVIQLIGNSLKANGYNDHQAATLFVTPSQVLTRISGVLGQ